MYVKRNANTCFQIHIKQIFHKQDILISFKKAFFSDLKVSKQNERKQISPKICRTSRRVSIRSI